MKMSFFSFYKIGEQEDRTGLAPMRGVPVKGGMRWGKGVGG
jgi:hypothetical protein